MNKQNLFDSIVIGAGMSGGWAAKEFCEKQMKDAKKSEKHTININYWRKEYWNLLFIGALLIFLFQVVDLGKIYLKKIELLVLEKISY